MQHLIDLPPDVTNVTYRWRKNWAKTEVYHLPQFEIFLALAWEYDEHNRFIGEAHASGSSDTSLEDAIVQAYGKAKAIRAKQFEEYKDKPLAVISPKGLQAEKEDLFGMLGL